MPIYEYTCQDCGESCEVLMRVSDTDPGNCPSCKTGKLKKRVSVSGFRLSGSGWYETDFKTENRRNLTADKSEDKGGKKSSEKSDDNKRKKKKEKTSAKPDTQNKSMKTSENKKSNTKKSSTTATKPSSSVTRKDSS